MFYLNAGFNEEVFDYIHSFKLFGTEPRKPAPMDAVALEMFVLSEQPPDKNMTHSVWTKVPDEAASGFRYRAAAVEGIGTADDPLYLLTPPEILRYAFAWAQPARFSREDLLRHTRERENEDVALEDYLQRNPKAADQDVFASTITADGKDYICIEITEDVLAVYNPSTMELVPDWQELIKWYTG